MQDRSAGRVDLVQICGKSHQAGGEGAFRKEVGDAEGDRGLLGPQRCVARAWS